MAMLEGKAIVITGSGRGIGAACAKGVARQGASVVVNDVDAAFADETVAAITATGGTAIANLKLTHLPRITLRWKSDSSRR